MSPNDLFYALAFQFRSWYKTFVSKSRTVGAKVQEARTTANLSRAQLAERVGCTEAAVRLWEDGHRTPRLKYVAGIARETGKDVSWFFEGVAA